MCYSNNGVGVCVYSSMGKSNASMGTNGAMEPSFWNMAMFLVFIYLFIE
jgi:hypothetical protein